MIIHMLFDLNLPSFHKNYEVNTTIVYNDLGKIHRDSIVNFLNINDINQVLTITETNINSLENTSRNITNNDNEQNNKNVLENDEE